MNNKKHDYREWTINRLFEHICGKVTQYGRENRSYWIGCLLAAKSNLDASVEILYDFLAAEILPDVQGTVDVLLEKIFAEIGD